MDHDDLARFVLQQMARIPPPSVNSQSDNPRPIMAIVDNLKDGLSRANPNHRSSAHSICQGIISKLGWLWEQNKPGADCTTSEDLRGALQEIANSLRQLPAQNVDSWNGDQESILKPGMHKMEGGKKRPAKRKDASVDKASKGLRHLSLRVCQKVEHKGRTTYGEVADELVMEILGEDGEDDQSFDEKNIRRRVYDALNVLLAMDMIMKDKKEISWIGLPAHTQVGLDSIRAKKADQDDNIKRKRARFNELSDQMTAYKRVIRRNTQQGPVAEEKRIYMPFIVVKTSKQNNIDCEVTEDYKEIFFNFSSDFEILNDMEILKKMGMHMPELDPFQPNQPTAPLHKRVETAGTQGFNPECAAPATIPPS
eukprot:TRINITY_DN25241_c0_g1_i1.p1 TRINITY_DN25241_c0_g1~~TRINITY_DN25241_c0_g1_i1.p1  ORF type:complete len:367 (-),score=81.54 TRINITY_DN25241_c0_g1_i1:292-1392(-)